MSAPPDERKGQQGSFEEPSVNVTLSIPESLKYGLEVLAKNSQVTPELYMRAILEDHVRKLPPHRSIQETS